MTAQPMYLGLPGPATKPAFYDGVLIKRLLAWVIDTVVIIVMCALILTFALFLGVFVFPFLMLVVGFFYRWFTIAGRSSTWGMRMTGIELRDGDGMRLQSEMALKHTAAYTVCVIFAPLQLVSAIAICLSDRKQGLPDILLGTTALNRPAV